MAVLLPYEYFKRPKRLRNRWLRERFGRLHLGVKDKDSRLIWVHAVSVGEVVTSVPLIKEIRKRHAALRIVLSTVTDTGQEIAAEKVAGIADIVYLPFDLPWVFRRALRQMGPALFIVMETELWPNIFRICKMERVPILICNGRLSDDSFKGYKKMRFFIKEVLKCVDLFCMQDRIYAERIMELGAEEGRVRVIGNLKFDTKPSGRLPEWVSHLEGTIILAGSTHEGEEELMVSAFTDLKKDFPDLNLILAPRHPDRFNRVEDMVRDKGLPYLRRSVLAHGSPIMVNDEKGDSAGQEQSAKSFKLSGYVIILDTIGELASVYRISDISVIGGSFVSCGGHNPLEPAFWGKPVICGPHMENFPFIQEFYIGSGAMKTDAKGLYEVLRELLRSPEKRKIMGERARALYDEKAGAVERAAQILERYLKP